MSINTIMALNTPLITAKKKIWIKVLMTQMQELYRISVLKPVTNRRATADLNAHIHNLTNKTSKCPLAQLTLKSVRVSAAAKIFW